MITLDLVRQIPNLLILKQLLAAIDPNYIDYSSSHLIDKHEASPAKRLMSDELDFDPMDGKLTKVYFINQ